MERWMASRLFGQEQTHEAERDEMKAADLAR